MVTINNAVTDILISSIVSDATCSNNDGSVQITSVSGGTGPYYLSRSMVSLSQVLFMIAWPVETTYLL